MQASEVGIYWEENAAAWIELSRAGYDTYRDAVNTPAFLALLPDISGQRGLDIGCGEGTNTRQVARLGAQMTGVDIAPSFVEAAQAVEDDDPTGTVFQLGDGTALPFPDESFDFATAFMSLMDMPDQARALKDAYRVLKPAGFLQFSILHPCFVPPKHKTIRREDGEAIGTLVADYFRRTDGEVETWTFSAAPKELRAKHPPFQVPRFHRTLSDWVAMITRAGFTLEALQEPMADEATAKAVPIVADTRITPIFLHFRLRKPG